MLEGIGLLGNCKYSEYLKTFGETKWIIFDRLLLFCLLFFGQGRMWIPTRTRSDIQKYFLIDCAKISFFNCYHNRNGLIKPTFFIRDFVFATQIVEQVLIPISRGCIPVVLFHTRSERVWIQQLLLLVAVAVNVLPFSFPFLVVLYCPLQVQRYWEHGQGKSPISLVYHLLSEALPGPMVKR